MLRKDVADACDAGKFHVYAVETIEEALEIMTGQPAGEFGPEGYTEGSMLHQAVEQAFNFWKRTLTSPMKLTHVATEGHSDDDQPVVTPEAPDEIA